MVLLIVIKHHTLSLIHIFTGFTDPEETPEERAEYFEQRYKGLSPEQRAELEAFDKENEELWLEQVEESIKENKVINNLILRFITGEDF